MPEPKFAISDKVEMLVDRVSAALSVRVERTLNGAISGDSGWLVDARLARLNRDGGFWLARINDEMFLLFGQERATVWE